MSESGAPSARRLLALLQLASPMLPVGAYAYSQGLERAVHDGIVGDAASAGRWIVDTLEGPLAHWEAPILARLHRAREAGNAAAFAHWNARFVASRDTAEMRAETLQMGASLASWAQDMGLGDGARSGRLPRADELSVPAAFACCISALSIDTRDGLAAYAWSWIENEVAAALKAVPLGQVAGQRLLLAAHAQLANAVDTAAALGDDDLVSSAPGLSLSSALHELQYSRLFRS